eukprot:246901-Prorocentrum_minimum.AAC.3
MQAGAPPRARSHRTPPPRSPRAQAPARARSAEARVAPSTRWQSEAAWPRASAPLTHTHGPIRRRKRGHILTTDQSDAATALLRGTPRTP